MFYDFSNVLETSRNKLKKHLNLISVYDISYLAIQQFIDGWYKFPYMTQDEKPDNRNRYSCQSTFFFSKQIFIALGPSIYYISTFLDKFDPPPISD